MKPFDLMRLYGPGPKVLSSMIALPLTYRETDHQGTMTWVRQGNGPHVTPMGFEGDGYEARLKSTTIPTWMAPSSARLTVHASIAFYPQKLKSTSEFVVCLGQNSANAYSKLIYAIRPDVTNANIPQMCLRGGTTGSSYVERTFGRSNWKYRFRAPELSYGAFAALPQGLVFLDADTLLLSVHFEGTFTRVYKIRLSDNAVLGYFDCTGDFAHLANLAFRPNGDLWTFASSNKGARVDLAASLASGSLVTLDVMGFSGLTAGALDFITVAGTEYTVIPTYATAGTPYFYIYPSSALGTTTLTAAGRYKRFTGCPIETQGCVMRDGKLWVQSIAQPGSGTSNRYGYFGRFDIATAIASLADGGALASELTLDAPTKYGEDCAVHPETNEMWTPTEGISGVGSEIGGLAVWSSPLDDSLVENHYTAEYDGAGNTLIKINNQVFDTMPGVLGNNVDVVAIGGPPVTGAGMTNRYFTGYVRNVVLQDQPFDTEQYLAAIDGTYEPKTLTVYNLTLVNPGAEDGTTAIGWTNESGGLGVLTYPGSTVNARTGVRLFSGGTSATTVGRQRLDILAQTGLPDTIVDSGTLWAKVRWWQSSYDSASDAAGLGLRTLNASNVSQGEVYSGIAWTPKSTSSQPYPWYPRCFAQTLPNGARSLDVLQKMTRSSGTNNDGWVDDISVAIYRP